MYIAKLKTLATLLLALTLLAGGSGLLGYRALSADRHATSPEAKTSAISAEDLSADQRDAAQENKTAEAQIDDKANAVEKFFYVDLQPKANQKLTDNFGSGMEGNNLIELPKGEHTFAQIRFKIGDGMLQLNSKLLKEQKTHIVEDINVGETFTKLHILHATGYGSGKEGGANFVADDTEIGEYRLQYEDGSTETVPIVYGQDVRDFWFNEKSPGVTRGKVAWIGKNEPTNKFQHGIRLYLTSWDNPTPHKKVTHIDYVKVNGSPAAPFCVAISLQQP